MLNDDDLQQPASADRLGGPVRDLLEALPVAVYTTDAEGLITAYNDAAAQLWGCRPELGTARWCGSRRLYWPDRTPMAHEDCPMAVALRENRVIRAAEIRAERPDGSLLVCLAFPTPLHDSRGTVTGAVNTLVDITDQKESQGRIRALLREVNHRVKNQFAVILSMIRESGKGAADPRQFERQVEDRVMALSRSHNLLVDGDWYGAELDELLTSHVSPFGGKHRVVARGPPLLLQPIAVQYLGMAFHELAANSAKGGVLSGAKGSIAVEWSVAGTGNGATFRLTWAESGRPLAAPDDNGGFGSIVLRRVCPSAIDGHATLEHGADGLAWTLCAPLAMVEQRRTGQDKEDRIAAILAARV